MTTCPPACGEFHSFAPGCVLHVSTPEPALIQVVIVPELRQPLERWLRANGLVLARIPGEEMSDDLPTYVVVPLSPTRPPQRSADS